MDTELQTALAEITTSVKDTAATLAAKQTDLAEKHRILNEQVAQIRASMSASPGMRGAPGAPSETGFPNYVSPGTQFTTKADVELAKKTGRLRFTLEQTHPACETKTLIDSAALGFSTPGILGDQRIEGIVPLPRRRLTVRDLLRSKPIGASQMSWIQELTFTSAASPVTDGGTKAESANTFQIASEKVRTVAHWIPVSKNVMDDLPELRRFIDENLVFGLKCEEEWELLFGDGTGEFLHGLYHQAGVYAGTYNAVSDTIIDKLRHVILEMALLNEECTGFILNPKDWHDAELVKTREGGVANTGSYVIGDPSGGTLRVPTVWGRAVVTCPIMTAGKFLAGNFANGVIGDRMGATIDVSDSHSDYFVKNKLALRAEERISLAVLRTTSFMRGDL